MVPDPNELSYPLERELASFTPAQLPEALRAHIAATLCEEPLTLGDRILAGFAALGGIAASVIVLIAVWQFTTPAPPLATPEEIAFHEKAAAEYQQLIALK